MRKPWKAGGQVADEEGAVGGLKLVAGDVVAVKGDGGASVAAVPVRNWRRVIWRTGSVYRVQGEGCTPIGRIGSDDSSGTKSGGWRRR